MPWLLSHCLSFVFYALIGGFVYLLFRPTIISPLPPSIYFILIFHCTTISGTYRLICFAVTILVFASSSTHAFSSLHLISPATSLSVMPANDLYHGYYHDLLSCIRFII